MFSLFILAGMYGGKWVSAQSISDETALRAARIALDAIRAGIVKLGGNGTINDIAFEMSETATLDLACTNGTIRGTNSSGEFIALFQDTSGKSLSSCGEAVSNISFVEVTGRFSGHEQVIGAKITDGSNINAVQCGLADGGSFSKSPEKSTLCKQGTPTEVVKSTDGEKWLWFCRDLESESSVSCSANRVSSSGGGLCGDAAKTYAANATDFSGAFCSKGNPEPGNPAFPNEGASVSWRCLVPGEDESDLCVATRLKSGSNDCSLITSHYFVPDGYGPPFNMLSSNQEPILTVSCDPGNVTAIAGNTALQMYTYNKGFVFSGSEWRAVSFSGTSASENPGWYKGVATSSSLPSAPTGGGNFVVAFICQYQDSEWKCGCRDSACTQNFWTIQRYGR
jgi:hypothetical protein